MLRNDRGQVDIPDDSVNTFPLLGSRFLTMQKMGFNNRRDVFSTWSMPGCYKQRNRLEPVSCEAVASREAEESPMIGAVARKRVVKTLQAREDLVFGAVICKVWRMQIEL
jgi:hypothetical protein